ncbi:MAG: AMP-binding protein, partial [Acidimicrobiales bacterium]
GQVTTWTSFNERVNRLTHGLRSAGLQPGDTLALVAGNRAEWFETAFACGHAGITYVPVNWHWVAEELAYVFTDAAVKGVVAGHRFADVTRTALDGFDLPLGLVAGDAGDDLLSNYEDFLAAQTGDEPHDQRLGGPMFYTSGTTGHPKGVKGALSGAHDAGPEIMSLVAAGFAEFTPADGRTLLCGPAYHSAQWAWSLLPMLNGSSTVMQHKFDAAGVLELIDRHQVTNVHLVPTQFKRLVDLPDDIRAGFDGSSLEVAWHGAAPCPPEIKRRMIEWWGPKIIEYYGSTEGSVISTVNSEEWLAKGGSVGKPVDTIEVIVLDDNNEPVEQGTPGTLYFRNLMGTDFEYHNAPEKTAEAHLEPGVFTTGDIGYLDDDGYLWLSDRKIDMVISGGVNIYPAEIEGVLNIHPAVADVAVIGIPDDEFGEAVKAVVQLQPEFEPSDELIADLGRHCREHLAGYKTPRSYDFTDAIPRTGTGKIRKQILREPYWGDRQI